MRQSRKRAAECEDGACFVRHRSDAGAHGLTRRGVSLCDATERLRHGVGTRQMRVGSLGPVAGNRDVDELRVDLLQLLIAKAVLLRRARAEVLPEDICAGDKLA